MALRIAIVGPGRVGIAFARQFVHAGGHVMAVIGRDRIRTKSCLDGIQPELDSVAAHDWADAQLGDPSVAHVNKAHVVVFAVGDEQLESAVRSAVSCGVRRCSLWLHTSGRHSLDVFAPALSFGVRTGSLHPLLPFSGSMEPHTMQGAPALLVGESRSMRLLNRLCAMLELRPVSCSGHHRVLYHAACALAANGATALFDTALNLMQQAGGLSHKDCSLIVASLMRAATTASEEVGPGLALSGPVRRGDVDTVSAHLSELSQSSPTAVPTYVALMQQALLLARKQGLSSVECEQLAKALLAQRTSS
ncbi:DUF2520 domain-containing protein [bacterium]|nr:DUF2520 domain-containing protein [bacterium]